MEKGTLIFTDMGDRGVSFGYEDYEVECFGGGDYEVIYTLDRENAEKMTRILAEHYSGSLKEMILQHFGLHMDQDSAYNWMEEHGVVFKLFTWQT
jgi:thiamine monophosphate kinase